MRATMLMSARVACCPRRQFAASCPTTISNRFVEDTLFKAVIATSKISFVIESFAVTHAVSQSVDGTTINKGGQSKTCTHSPILKWCSPAPHLEECCRCPYSATTSEKKPSNRC